MTGTKILTTDVAQGVSFVDLIIKVEEQQREIVQGQGAVRSPALNLPPGSGFQLTPLLALTASEVQDLAIFMNVEWLEIPLDQSDLGPGAPL